MTLAQTSKYPRGDPSMQTTMEALDVDPPRILSPG